MKILSIGLLLAVCITAAAGYADLVNRPRYIRFESTGNITAGVFYDGLKQAWDLRFLDVDVSADGKVWRHALGPKCLEHAPVTIN